MREIQQKQTWLQPSTGETVTLTFDGQATHVTRDGQTSEIQPQKFDEAAEIAATRELLKSQYQWDVPNVALWRDHLIMSAGSLQQARQEFKNKGFPDALWTAIDDYQIKLGYTRSGPGQPLQPAVGSFGMEIVPEGEQATGGSGTVVFRLDDPALKDNLLFHPTPEVRKLFEQEYLHERINVSAPPPDTTFHEQVQALGQQGFIRLTTRNPGGALWLPPVLEPHRAQLMAYEQPVVRPVVKPDIPEPWDSKFGGVPYRPEGSAWPTQASGKPLAFLAQIDLGAANSLGHLPDFPKRGLLQFFLAYSDAPYEEIARNPQLSEPAVKVLYWPDIQRDRAALDFTEPKLTQEFEDEYFNPPERALSFIPDTEIPSLLDDHLQWLGAQVETSDEINTHVKGHRLGGHAMLVNAHFPPEQGWRLLFQFDGDDVGSQIYGESGLGGWLGFFLRESDLKQLEFSRVRLEMDAF